MSDGNEEFDNYEDDSEFDVDNDDELDDDDESENNYDQGDIKCFFYNIFNTFIKYL
jgi:hypothetical protein